MNKPIFRIVGAILLVDGLSTLIFGHRYVGMFLFGPRDSFYRKLIASVLRWPSLLLRVAGASEALLGATVLRRTPIPVRSLYQSLAGGYAAIDPGWREWFYPQAHQAFDQALVDSLPTGGMVLDLGSGIGANMSRLIQLKLHFGSYLGVDLTPAMLQQAGARYGHLPNVAFQQIDLLQDALPEGPFDLIVSTWVFEHLPDPVFVAEKAWERLKPGGAMVLLFEVETNTFLSRLFGWIYPFLSVRLVKENEVRAMPGKQTIQYFSGPVGEVAVVRLSKQS